MAVSEASDELLEALDQMFYYLESVETRGGRRSLARGRGLKRRRAAANPLRGWCGILPLHRDYLDRFYDDETVLNDVSIGDLETPIDVRTCIPDGACDEKIVVHRLRHHKPLHGRPRIRWYNALISEGGKVHSIGKGGPGYKLLTLGPNGWEYPTSVVDPQFGGSRLRQYTKVVSSMVQSGIAIAFEAPRHWYVDLGYHPGGPSVAIQTDASGVLALLQDRDRQPAAGDDRRDALLQWVDDHYCRKPHWDAESAVQVRVALQGLSTFEWSGMYGSVRPSEEELQFFLGEDQKGVST